jgi:hypothetical protein
MRDRIELLGAEVSRNFKRTFTSERTQGDADEGGTKPTKRARTSCGGQGGNGLQRGEHPYYGRLVVDVFKRAGYTLGSNDKDENGWALLNKVMQPSTRCLLI